MTAVTSGTVGKKVERKKRKLERAKLVRLRRRTIDPTKWDSQHLKGAFLDSIIVAHIRGDLPATKSLQPQTSGGQGESDFSSSEEGREEGDGSDSSESEITAGDSQTSPGTTSRPPPATHVDCDVVNTDLDFNKEKLRALSLLDSMFGDLEENRNWGGKERLDSDVDMPDPPPVQSSPASTSSPSRGSSKGPDLTLVVKEVQEDSSSEKSSPGVPSPAVEHIPMSGTIQNTTTTKAKLKDLFAPQEEQSTLPLMNYV